MQGLSGKQWTRPVSDNEAASLLRADPNFQQGSLTDSDEATAQTVRFMIALVKHSLEDPIIGQAWRDAWQRFHGVAFGNEAVCVWWYARYLIKFVHHQELLRDWLWPEWGDFTRGLAGAVVLFHDLSGYFGGFNCGIGFSRISC